MNIPLPEDSTEEDVVDLVIRRALQGVTDNDIESELVATFSLSVDEAALARDRVFGGIVRGATRNPLNRPNQKMDPLAAISYQRAIDDSEIVAKIYPNDPR